eukprot:TRINITY_DN7850_c0_g1_i1.p1 TRINITY_DN7850_c0_g1~~TRINITY_DN7850_c0_g1_i1.p1  ORF type:complete len:563 (+),score=182.94 TRINITY_DN7850_c0_g1_i1:89-1777(+)
MTESTSSSSSYKPEFFQLNEMEKVNDEERAKENDSASVSSHKSKATLHSSKKRDSSNDKEDQSQKSLTESSDGAKKRLRKPKPTLDPEATLPEKIKFHVKTKSKQLISYIGPGLVVSVAYMDPGNYGTDLAAGSQFGYDLLFVVLLSSIIACFLQSLTLRLGSVTGLDLAQVCQRELPVWLKWIVYLAMEAAVIATDFAEVVGGAIAFNLLFGIPLWAGVLLTGLDTFVVLFAFREDGKMRNTRIFEAIIASLVLGVDICFAIQLSKIKPDAKSVMRGYVPSGTLFTSGGAYAAVGILGATVMPHSLFVGSKIVQARVLDEDDQEGIHEYVEPSPKKGSMPTPGNWPYSVQAIRRSIPWAIGDLSFSLLTFALFVNSAILIVAAHQFYAGGMEVSDLFAAYELLDVQVGKAAAVLFAVSLLFSGLSSSIVATLAGQIVSEGFINWKLKPWIRRIVTRSIAIVPAIIVVSVAQRKGIDALLLGSQATLSILLPFAVFPLVWFTSMPRIMTVEEADLSDEEPKKTSFTNPLVVKILGGIICFAILGLNVYLIAKLIEQRVKGEE